MTEFLQEQNRDEAGRKPPARRLAQIASETNIAPASLPFQRYGQRFHAGIRLREPGRLAATGTAVNGRNRIDLGESRAASGLNIRAAIMPLLTQPGRQCWLLFVQPWADG
jgi:hypothetical protein